MGTNTQKVKTKMNLKLKKYKQMAKKSGLQTCCSHWSLTGHLASKKYKKVVAGERQCKCTKKSCNKYKIWNGRNTRSGLQTCTYTCSCHWSHWPHLGNPAWLWASCEQTWDGIVLFWFAFVRPYVRPFKYFVKYAFKMSLNIAKIFESTKLW